MRRWGAVLWLAVMLGSAPAAEAVWGRFPFKLTRPPPPDQSWLADLPERRSRGKIAVFEFKGDDVYQPVREAVVKLLRRRGFNVTVTLKRTRTDGAVEFREISETLNLAAYVGGEMSGEGERQRAVITFYSGVTGHRMAVMGFSGPTGKIVADLKNKLWTRVGPAMTRACASVSKPRAPGREPLRIDASDTSDDS